jgi:hypothetical protein
MSVRLRTELALCDLREAAHTAARPSFPLAEQAPPNSSPAFRVACCFVPITSPASDPSRMLLLQNLPTVAPNARPRHPWLVSPTEGIGRPMNSAVMGEFLVEQSVLQSKVDGCIKRLGGQGTPVIYAVLSVEGACLATLTCTSPRPRNAQAYDRPPGRSCCSFAPTRNRRCGSI